MQRLAESSPDTSEHRQDEPYRRALTGIYARLAATLAELSGGQAMRHAVAPQNAYPHARPSFWPSCAPLSNRSPRTTARPWARSACTR
jgi:phosphoenolpyruvate carboxylase